MKKSYKFNDLSDQTCQGKGCQSKLKMRRVVEHKDTLCYKCNIRAKLRAGKWANHPGKLKRAGIY